MGNERIPDVNEKLFITTFELKDSLQKSSRTSRLWINYMSYINIVKSFIRAERTDNLHLLLTIDLFTTAGHIHCSKSARLNLQIIALTSQNNIYGYISNSLKRLIIQDVLAVANGPVYGLVLSQSRSLIH